MAPLGGTNILAGSLPFPSRRPGFDWILSKASATYEKIVMIKSKGFSLNLTTEINKYVEFFALNILICLYVQIYRYQ
jgi:hypothetical protein